MIKWPEPVGGAYVRPFQSARETKTEWIDKVYTEAQLKQALRDFGEQCAQLVFLSCSAEQAEMRIRALIKEIQ